MSKNRKAPREFRRMQVVSPVPSGRRYAKSKSAKKTFDIYITNLENGEDHFGGTVQAPSQREALQIAKKRHLTSPLMRRITHAAFIAVEVKD